MIKKKSLLFTLLLVGCWASVALARPASSIEMVYDQELEVLEYKIAHISKNPRDHHIRKMLVLVNDEEAKVVRFVTQTSSRGMAGKLHLKAAVGDTVILRVFCNKAGHSEESLEIISTEISDEKK